MTSFLALLFFIQPVLVFIYCPLVLAGVFFYLWYYQRKSLFRALLYALLALIFCWVTIALVGIFIVPFLGHASLSTLMMPLHTVVLMLATSSLIYTALIVIFLRLCVSYKEISVRAIAAITGVSALIVTVLYAWLWLL